MIQINDLFFGYKKKSILFDQLNLQIPKGNIYGLLGRNGAGKTTLLKQMAGLLFPQKGEVRILGKHTKERIPELLSDLYFIPEEFELPAISMKTFIHLHSPFYPKYSQQQLDKYLTEFEINLNSKLTSLSYGQKKKFLISFGLATNTSLLILDEPTNGLDIPSKSQFRRIIAASMDDERCILISTHQVRDLSSLIDHIIILENGKVVFDQSTNEISTKLSFSHSKEPNQENTLYSESVMGGYAVISRRMEEETEIDLELLFNGVVSKTEILNNEFKN